MIVSVCVFVHILLLYLHYPLSCSEKTRRDTEIIKEEYATKENKIVTKTDLFKKEIEAMQEELKGKSLIKKGLKEGNTF